MMPKFYVDPPCYRNSPVEIAAFNLYAMDITRREQIEKVIELLAAAGEECNNFEVQCAIYREVGINSDTFTDREVSYIENEVARRLR